MTVWVVKAFSAEPYEHDTWIESIHVSEEVAKAYVTSKGKQPINADRYEYGHFLMDPEEYTVQGIVHDS